MALAVHEIAQPCLSLWSDIAFDTNVQTWTALSGLVADVVNEVTGSRPRIVQRVTLVQSGFAELTHRTALKQLRDLLESQSRDYVADFMSKELSRQDHVDEHTFASEDAASILDTCERELKTFCTRINVDTESSGGQPRRFFEDIYPRETAGTTVWPQAYQALCVETATLVRLRLTRAAKRVHAEILREINHRLLRFLKSIPATLRAAFELDELSRERKRKLSELCDVDRATADERAKLQRQQESLIEAQNMMKDTVED